MKFSWTLPLLMLAGLVTAHTSTPQSGTPVAATAAAAVPAMAAQNIPGAPFSADVINETDRTAQNANPIHYETHGKLYRDTAGRTRRETETQNGGRFVTITDSVQHVIIVLNSRNKTARVYPWPPAVAGAQAAGPGASANLPARPWSTQAQSPVAANVAPNAAPRAVGATLAPVSASLNKVSSEKLQSRQLEGVMVDGMRVTRTTETGAAGNEKPIVSTTETWTSPQMKLTILVESNDPRSGKTMTKLVNLIRTEPDASLFQVPADYTVTDNTKK